MYPSELRLEQGTDGSPGLEFQLDLEAPWGGSSASGSFQLTVRVELPPGYPVESPPNVTVESKAATRESIAKANERLRAEVPAISGARGGRSGSECLLELVEYVRDEVSKLMECPAAAEAKSKACNASGKGCTATGNPKPKPNPNLTLCAAVIMIDHMNDAKGYMKKLRKWTDQLGARGLLWWRMGPRRVESVVVLLAGRASVLKAFVTRLRTQYVDVNSRGDRCREKQSRVCWEGKLGFGGSGHTLPVSGLKIVEYTPPETSLIALELAKNVAQSDDANVDWNKMLTWRSSRFKRRKKGAVRQAEAQPTTAKRGKSETSRR